MNTWQKATVRFQRERLAYANRVRPLVVKWRWKDESAGKKSMPIRYPKALVSADIKLTED